jgi:hypothetical protein
MSAKVPPFSLAVLDTLDNGCGRLVFTPSTVEQCIPVGGTALRVSGLQVNVRIHVAPPIRNHDGQTQRTGRSTRYRRDMNRRCNYRQHRQAGTGQINKRIGRKPRKGIGLFSNASMVKVTRHWSGSTPISIGESCILYKQLKPINAYLYRLNHICIANVFDEYQNRN